MRPNKPSIDGFVPRRPNGQAINSSYRAAPAATGTTGLMQRRGQVSVRDESAQTPVLTRSGQGLTRQEVSDSLSGLGNTLPPKKGLRRRGNDGRVAGQKKRIAKWVAITLAVVILGIGGYLGYKMIHAGGNVFKSGSLLSLFQNQPLKQDANGRSNILILGTAEDDPGHDAGYLTDSIMVLSIDQKNKTAAMFSIPRDLEVKYGMGCASGYSGKINVYFSCVNNGTDTEAEQDRLTKTQQFMGGIVGMDIQYGVHVNYTVMRDIVKAVGDSITVNIEGSGGAPGVMDSNFDWKCRGGKAYASVATMKKNCPPNGHFIDYPNGPATLDSEHALYLAQARGDVMPTYGLGNSNFDRERNQQKIMLAIKEKALSAGTLTDFGKVSSLIDAMDKNLRTNFDVSEIRTLTQLGADIKSDSIMRIDLMDQSKGAAVFTANAQPTAGMYQYDQIRAYIRKQLSADPVAREGASVIVLNGTETAGVAQTEADKLDKLGMTIARVGNAPKGSYGKATLYQVGTGMTATKAKLEALYGVKASADMPPVTVTGDTNFVLIIGETATTTSGSTTTSGQ